MTFPRLSTQKAPPSIKLEDLLHNSVKGSSNIWFQAVITARFANGSAIRAFRMMKKNKGKEEIDRKDLGTRTRGQKDWPAKSFLRKKASC